MTRTYISTIPTLLEWKHEELSFYSDIHKDIHGCRWVPEYLLNPEHSMEEVMESMSSLLAESNARFEVDTYVYTPVMFTNNITF